MRFKLMSILSFVLLTTGCENDTQQYSLKEIDDRAKQQVSDENNHSELLLDEQSTRSTEQVTEEIATTEKPTTEAPTTEKPTTEEPSSESSRDGQVEYKDGIPYVGGHIIVNKDYKLPADYNPGLSHEAKKQFDKMQQNALSEGYQLIIVSEFRSYTYQQNLYQNYIQQHGKQEADRFSAPPGHSEHQTGLAIDVATPESAQNSMISFGQTKASAWVRANAHRYGFIVRYPKGKEHITGYMYEPWHLRYLNIDDATKIYKSKLTMEEYYNLK